MMQRDHGITIKGDFFYYQKALFFMVFSFLMIPFAILVIDEYNEGAVLAVLAFIVLGLVSWWSASASCYYYVVAPGRMIVKNRLSNYHKEYLISEIDSVALHGDLSLGMITGGDGNCINIRFRDHGMLNSKIYYSANLNKHNWMKLINAMHNVGIKLEDPSGKYFEESGYEMPK